MIKNRLEKLLLEATELEYVALELLEHGPMTLPDFMSAFRSAAQIGITKSLEEKNRLVVERHIKMLKHPIDERKTVVARHDWETGLRRKRGYKRKSYSSRTSCS